MFQNVSYVRIESDSISRKMNNFASVRELSEHENYLST